MEARDSAPVFEGSDGRRVVILFAVVTTIVAGFFGWRLLGEFTGSGMSDMPGMAESNPPRGLRVAAFASRLASPGVFVINVHAGGRLIAGTDESIPFDSIVGDKRLPRDRTTPLALYCRTGRMSQEAARSLRRAGFSDVAYLMGGTDAWAADGRTFG